MEPLGLLVQAAQEGDAEVFKCIVERFQDMAYASAYALVGDIQLAEDVAQEAFLEAYLNLAKLREPAAFASWFRRIIFKQADRLTRGKYLVSSSLDAAVDVPAGSAGPPEIVEAHEMSERIRRAVSDLPERERLVVMLFYGTGYALKDIAAFLDIPIPAVKKRLYTARRHLKDELIESMGDVLQEQRPSLFATLPAKVRLLIAARLGDIDAVKILLTRSPMLLNMRMERGETRFQRVLSTAPGITALHEAAMYNHVEVVRLLCAYGANCDARTSSGLTPLHGATLYRCYAAATVLLTCGANVELALSSGLTALHLAAMKGNSEMVGLLLTHGASSSSRSRHARTPLHWAALKGHSEVAQLLLAHGADREARDTTGRTPYDWALLGEHRTLATLLSRKDDSMSTSLLPVGSTVLGRVLNARGEPLDRKGDLAQAPRQPLYIPHSSPVQSETTETHMLETGIKVLDLLAPAAYGSLVGLLGGSGLGVLVVAEEIMHTLITRHQAVIVVADMGETTYAASSLYEMVRESEAEERVVMLFEQTTDAPSVRQRLLCAALTIAAHFGDAGREVLLLVDGQLITPEGSADLRQFAVSHRITSLLFVPMSELDQPMNGQILNELDVQWWFSRERAKKHLWPAIDPLASCSRILASAAMGAEHQQVAQRVRDILQRYHTLQEQVTSVPFSAEERRLLVRAERINLFLGQPFVVAEAYTDLPGAYLTLEETISSFRDLLDGRYDALPASAFNFIGKIEQA